MQAATNRSSNECDSRPDFGGRLFHFERRQDAVSVHIRRHPSTGLPLVVARECQIFAAPTALLFEAFSGVNTLVAEPKTTIVIFEDLHRSSTRMQNAVADNWLLSIVSRYHRRLLRFESSRCIIKQSVCEKASKC
jgi:hypothetical protein